MSVVVQERIPTAPICSADGMPLYPTIVGLRCPLCGAQATRVSGSPTRLER